MPSLSRACSIAVALVGALALEAGAAAKSPAAPSASSREALLAAARAIMDAARYCAVITTDKAGRPQARTVDPFPPDTDMVVWFATNPKSRKVAELRRDPRVTLHYFDSRSPQLGYVTLLGRARLVDDPAEKQKRWNHERVRTFIDIPTSPGFGWLSRTPLRSFRVGHARPQRNQVP